MSREMTGAELRVWNKFKKSVKLAHLESLISFWREGQLNIQIRFAKRHALPVSTVPQKSIDELTEVRKKIDHLARLIGFAESGEIGVSFSKGDMNFVAPKGTTTEQMAIYTSLGGGPAIIVGIIIIVAVVAYIYYLRKLNAEREKMLKKMVKHNNDRFCKNKNTSECQAWLKERETEGYNRNDLEISGLTETINEVGSTLLSGGKWGIGIAIPLVVAYMLWQKDKKNAR